mgnify:FL=1|tara:strand:+ start:93 stop:506 length:414 start_codon:yes stop_codon:yes gene_type:complete
MKITIVKKLNNTFAIAYNTDYELAKKLKVGVEYQCEIKRPRNYNFHKKYFALLTMLFDNQERYSNKDHLRKDLTIEAGFYTVRKNLKGVEVYEANSISFSSMKQESFDDLYSKTLDVIVKYFNFDKEEIINNVEQYF